MSHQRVDAKNMENHEKYKVAWNMSLHHNRDVCHSTKILNPMNLHCLPYCLDGWYLPLHDNWNNDQCTRLVGSSRFSALCIISTCHELDLDCLNSPLMMNVALSTTRQDSLDRHVAARCRVRDPPAQKRTSAAVSRPPSRRTPSCEKEEVEDVAAFRNERGRPRAEPTREPQGGAKTSHLFTT